MDTDREPAFLHAPGHIRTDRRNIGLCIYHGGLDRRGYRHTVEHRPASRERCSCRGRHRHDHDIPYPVDAVLFPPVYKEPYHCVQGVAGTKIPVQEHKPRFFFNHYHFPERNRSDEADENDSPFAVIAGVRKYYGIGHDELIRRRSWLNVQMLFNTIPSFDTDKEEGPGKTEKTKKQPKAIHANELFF